MIASMRASISLALCLLAQSSASTDTAVCPDKQDSCDELSMLQSRVGVNQEVSTNTDATSRTRQDSLVMGRLFAGLASEQPAESDTQKLFESFRLCGQCGSFRRFGASNDGGYLMCMDGFKDKAVQAAYSLGVREEDKWSEDVIKEFNLVVNQFDCTVDSGLCQGCKFFKKCIASADGKNPGPKGKENDWSLSQALQETSQASAADGSLLLKMDIEGSEWAIYASEPSETLKKFGQILVEFHSLQKEDKHAEYLQAVQNILAAGFKVAHLHGNNFEGMYTVGNKTIPDVLEVTFVNGAARADGCSATQEMLPLDSPNNAGSPELPVANLAF